LGSICLAASPFCFSQTKDRQPEDTRIKEQQADIRLLKQVVDAQNRRIAELEKAVKALQTAAAANADKPASEERLKAGKLVPNIPWQIPFAWTRLKNGMSRVEVEEILGPPTSVESVLDYQTLLYQGDVPGSGMVSGMVKLVDDRVSQVDAPDF
jgi:hypothetical protein